MAKTQVTKDDVKDQAITPAKISDITPSANQIPYMASATAWASDETKLGFDGENLGVGQPPGTERIEVDGAVKVGEAVGTADGTLQYSTGFQGRQAGSWSQFIFGGGTAYYVTRFTGAVNIGNSIIQDNGSTIGIGQPPGPDMLTVAGPIRTNSTFYDSGGAVGPGIDGRGVIVVPGDYSPTAAQSGSTLVCTSLSDQNIYLPSGTAGLNFVIINQRSKIISPIKFCNVRPLSGQFIQVGTVLADVSGGFRQSQSGAVITLICAGSMPANSAGTTTPHTFPGGVVWFATSQSVAGGTAAAFIWSWFGV